MRWFLGINHLNELKCYAGQGKWRKGHCDLIPLQIVFILIFLNTKVQLIMHAKFRSNIPSGSEEKC